MPVSEAVRTSSSSSSSNRDSGKHVGKPLLHSPQSGRDLQSSKYSSALTIYKPNEAEQNSRRYYQTVHGNLKPQNFIQYNSSMTTIEADQQQKRIEWKSSKRENGVYLGPGDILEFEPDRGEGYLAYQAFLLKRGLHVSWWEKCITLPTMKTKCDFFKQTPNVINLVVLEILLFEKLMSKDEPDYILMFDKYENNTYIGLGSISSKENNLFLVHLPDRGFIKLHPTTLSITDRIKPQALEHFTEKFLGWGILTEKVVTSQWSSCKSLHSLAMMHTILKIEIHKSIFRTRFEPLYINWVDAIESNKRDLYWFGGNSEPEYRAKQSSVDCRKHDVMLTWWDGKDSEFTDNQRSAMIQFFQKNNPSEQTDVEKNAKRKSSITSQRKGNSNITYSKFKEGWETWGKRSQTEYEWIKAHIDELVVRFQNPKLREKKAPSKVQQNDDDNDENEETESSMIICEQHVPQGIFYSCPYVDDKYSPFHKAKNYFLMPGGNQIAWNTREGKIDASISYYIVNEMPGKCTKQHQRLIHTIMQPQNLTYIPSPSSLSTSAVPFAESSYPNAHPFGEFGDLSSGLGGFTDQQHQDWSNGYHQQYQPTTAGNYTVDGFSLDGQPSAAGLSNYNPHDNTRHFTKLIPSEQDVPYNPDPFNPDQDQEWNSDWE
jgi:hypothetical protein